MPFRSFYATCVSALLLSSMPGQAKPTTPDPWVHPFVAECEKYFRTGDKRSWCYTTYSKTFGLRLSFETEKGTAAARYCLRADRAGSRSTSGFVQYSAGATVLSLDGEEVEPDELIRVILAYQSVEPTAFGYETIELEDKIVRTPKHRVSEFEAAAFKAHFCGRSLNKPSWDSSTEDDEVRD